MDINALLSNEFSTDAAIISRIVSLIDEGNTIPFIARYRKEMTGAMDDQKLREISERLDYLRGLDKRREQITASISEQGKFSEEIEKKLAAAVTLSELEDMTEEYWWIRDDAVTRVVNLEGLEIGSEHTVHVHMQHRIPYTGYEGEYGVEISDCTKTLVVK